MASYNLSIEVDYLDAMDGKLTAVQIWDDGLEIETSMHELIIIMANRSTCLGKPNEGMREFSHCTKELVTEPRVPGAEK